MELRSTTEILKLDSSIRYKFIHALVIALVFSLILPPNIALARPSASVGSSMFSNEVQSTNPAFTGISEFFYRNDRDDVLVPVFVLGAVSKPGLYHVPIKSDLITLLSVSGGATADADLASITVKNQQTNEVHELDLAEVVSSKKMSDLALKGNEVVFVKPRSPAISNNTATLVGVIAGLMSIVLSAVVIRRETK